MAAQVDQSIAALLKDLKARGILDETLVIWAGEFGRTPFSQGSNGRDHNLFDFSIWMSGGGVKGRRSTAPPKNMATTPSRTAAPSTTSGRCTRQRAPRCSHLSPFHSCDGFRPWNPATRERRESAVPTVGGSTAVVVTSRALPVTADGTISIRKSEHHFRLPHQNPAGLTASHSERWSFYPSRISAQCSSSGQSCISINMLYTNEKTLTHYRMPISAEGLSGRYWI